MRFATFARTPTTWEREIDKISKQEDRRLDELREWLARFDDLELATLAPASIDASFRRYFRVRTRTESLIAMDAPPEREDCRPFIRVAGYLEQMNLNSPRIIRSAPEQGFLLLTDLGSRQYLQELKERPERVGELYGDALSVILRLQEQGGRFQGDLPPYDDKLLRFEMSLFRDWLCLRHLDLDLSAREELHWQSTVDFLAQSALSQPKVFVHRDFHSRNLMVTDENNPGILDFQDAVEGPFTYDLVSLLKDCYIRWPAEQVNSQAVDFYAALADRGLAPTSQEQFMRSFELMGVQRQLKAAGIFARLNYRDGKPVYLEDVPRTLGYIVEIAPRHPELGFLGQLISERCLPALPTGRAQD
ncbi:MAG TPA: phosphotransferase [Woeseiaceae bacterium]|nr:phosphotransferase [Woeseiaceae bacterium]